jgi:hypothetical protein
VIAVAAVQLAAAGCSTSDEPPAIVRVAATVERPADAERTRLSGWRLPGAGWVTGMAAGENGVVVAQPRRLTTLSASATVELDAPAEHRIVAISPRAERVAVHGPGGFRVGRADSYDPSSTAISESPDGPVLVLDGDRDRILRSSLWDLGAPASVWFPEVYVTGSAMAVDATQRWVALGGDDGRVTLISVEDGRLVRVHSRIAPGPMAPEVVAVAVSPSADPAWLDRGGWVSCGERSVRALSVAPPGLVAAIALVDEGVWVLRGGRAALVTCRERAPRVACEVTTGGGDLRSAALLAVDGRVFAAGLARHAVVELPECS